MIVPFLQIIGDFSVRYRVLYIKQRYFIRLLKQASARWIWRHRFWRVLALEEFTDVQCVIVDHPMPSLAGYRIIGSSPFNIAHQIPDFRPLLGHWQDVYWPTSLEIPFGNLRWDERCNLVLKRTRERVTLWRSLSRHEESGPFRFRESNRSRFVARAPRKSREAVSEEQRSIMDIIRRHGSLVRISRACPTPAQWK